jgi:DNA end-binding protein Ku
MLKLAEQILKSKAINFDPSQFVDRYEQAVIELLKKKRTGIAVSRERTAPQSQNVVNIIDALRQSIAQEKAAPPPPKKSPKRIHGQGEMLLPIAGRAKKVATAKPPERAKHATKKCRLTPYPTVVPIAARKSRRRFETPKIQLASGMPPGVP